MGSPASSNKAGGSTSTHTMGECLSPHDCPSLRIETAYRPCTPDAQSNLAEAITVRATDQAGISGFLRGVLCFVQEYRVTPFTSAA